MSKKEKNLNYKIRKLGLSTRIASSSGVREMTVAEKSNLIKKTEKWIADFKKHGKPLGPKTVMFRGKKYTKHGVLI